MKKSDLILIGVVVIIAIFAFVSSKGNIKLKDVDYPLTLVGEAGMQEITYKQYDKFVTDEEAFIVVIERDGCSYCTMYMPVVEEVAKEKKIPLYYIDIAKMSKEDLGLLNTKNSYLKKNSDWGTPTTLFMLGNRVLDTISGYVDKKELLSFLDGKVVVGE